MDRTNAQSLLKRLLCLLPQGYWFPLLPKEDNEVGLADIFKRPRLEIEALLVNAGACGPHARLGTTLNERVHFSFVKATSIVIILKYR